MKQLKDRIEELRSIRNDLCNGSADLSSFLDWFDRWFMQRAALREAES